MRDEGQAAKYSICLAQGSLSVHVAFCGNVATCPSSIAWLSWNVEIDLLDFFLCFSQDEYTLTIVTELSHSLSLGFESTRKNRSSQGFADAFRNRAPHPF